MKELLAPSSAQREAEAKQRGSHHSTGGRLVDGSDHEVMRIGGQSGATAGTGELAGLNGAQSAPAGRRMFRCSGPPGATIEVQVSVSPTNS